MENLGWGLQISLVGMGLVFGLLALLWALLRLVLHFDRGGAVLALATGSSGERVAGQAVGRAPEPARGTASPGELEPALVAAISAAVLAHVARRRKEAAPPQRMHWPGSLLHASRWVASGRLRQNRTFRKGR